jgi:AAA family ATP:ADP antiporter
MSNTDKEFGKWRAFFWPVHAHEIKKIVPMLLLYFCICYNYTLLRDIKDTLIVTKAGAEAIPFLKVWGIVPAAILFTLTYAKLSNMLSKSLLFYVSIVPFLLFFAIFILFLYPNEGYLQLDSVADWLFEIVPAGCMGFVQAIRFWSCSLFYIFAELWGSVVLTLLFWGFANDTTDVVQAKRFYGLFGIGAAVALSLSGQTVLYASDGITWDFTLEYAVMIVLLLGVASMALYWWINRYAVRYEMSKEKPKLSIRESLIYLSKSPHILLIALLVVCYGISLNLIEVTWKSQLKLMYPDPHDYINFMGHYSTSTGIITLLILLFVTGAAIRKSWSLAALITPIVLLVTGTAFFAFVLFNDLFLGVMAIFGTSPLMMAVLFGAAQNILCKSAKYSLFDPTKEMAYIPLDQESKVKGKAAIDVVGARLGKSGGSLIQQLLLIVCGSMHSILPYTWIILFIITGIWIYAILRLKKSVPKIALS